MRWAAPQTGRENLVTLDLSKQFLRIVSFAAVGAVGISLVAEIARSVFPPNGSAVAATPPPPPAQTIIAPNARGSIIAPTGGNNSITNNKHVVIIRKQRFVAAPKTGILVPAGDAFPDPPAQMREEAKKNRVAAQIMARCWLYPNSKEALSDGALAVKLGSNVVISFQNPVSILQFGDEAVLSVDRDRGKITVGILRIIDDRDNQLLRMDARGYSTDPLSHMTVLRPDPSTLVVEDHLGKVLLRIRYLNPSAMTVEGKFRYPGFGSFTINSDELTISPRGHVAYNCEIGANPNVPVFQLMEDGTTHFG